MKTRLLALVSLWPLAAIAQQPATASKSAFAVAMEAAERGELRPLQEALMSASKSEWGAVLRARLAASQFQPIGPDSEALLRLATAADQELRSAALSVLTDVAFVNGQYRAAAAFGRDLSTALRAQKQTESAAGSDRTHLLAELLSTYGATRVDGVVKLGSVPASRDKVNLPRVAIRVRGETVDAIFDTGANLSVLSASTAKRMGIAVLESRAAVGNSVQGTVPVRVGIADQLEIAGTILRDVVFLIIDDAQLTFPVPGGYDIPAIIGLPIMRQLGAVKIERDELTVLAPASTSRDRGNLHAAGNNLFVDVTVDGVPYPLHFDTGANQTRLHELFATANRDRVATFPNTTSRSAGAGGVRESRVARWPSAPLVLAGREVVLPTLEISVPTDTPRPERYYGRLGSDVLNRFESYTIDFIGLRLELGPPIKQD